jgi:hypothetical protein
MNPIFRKGQEEHKKKDVAKLKPFLFFSYKNNNSGSKIQAAWLENGSMGSIRLSHLLIFQDIHVPISRCLRQVHMPPPHSIPQISVIYIYIYICLCSSFLLLSIIQKTRSFTWSWSVKSPHWSPLCLLLALSFHTLLCRLLFFHDYCIERLIFLGSIQPYLLSRVRSLGPVLPFNQGTIFSLNASSSIRSGKWYWNELFFS